MVIGGAGGMGRVLAEGLCGVWRARSLIADISERQAGERGRGDRRATATGEVEDIRGHSTDRREHPSSWCKNIVADMGRVHMLVNAQGFNVKSAATEFPVESWDKLFSANVRGVMLCCKNFAAHMVEQGGGKIINLSSIRGQRAALGGNMGYCATKGAVDMITRTMAVELAPKGVFVNALGPIITATPMTKETIKNNPERYAKTARQHPHGTFWRARGPHRSRPSS